MKRIQTQYYTNFWIVFKRMFLGRSSNPIVLEIILLLVEALIFTYYMSSNYRPAEELKLGSYHYLILAGMLVCLLARYLLNVTLSKLLFLPTLFCVLTGNFDDVLKAVILVLLLLNTLIEVLSNVEYEFMTQNPSSESLNHTKFLHCFVLLIGTVLRTNQ